MKVIQAPEPQEIIWENSNVPENRRILLKILGWGLSFFVLFAVAVVFYFLLSARAMTILQTIEDYHADPTN